MSDWKAFGIAQPLSDAEYYSHDYVGSTDITRALGLQGPSGPRSIEGRALHTAVLEPHLFDGTYIVPPPDALPGSGRGQRARLDEWRAGIDGLTEISQEAADRCHRAAEAIRAMPLLRAVLDSPMAEVERGRLVIHEDTGLKVRWKPDLRVPGVIVDLKSSANPEFYAFMRAAERYLYCVQAALYVDLQWSVDETPSDFVWVAFGGDPIRVGMYRASDAVLDIGRRLYCAGLAKIAKSRETGTPVQPWWTGKVLDSEKPSWFLERFADIVEGSGEGEK